VLEVAGLLLSPPVVGEALEVVVTAAAAQCQELPQLAPTRWFGVRNCMGTVITTGAVPGTVVGVWSRLKWTPSPPVEAKVVLLAGVAS
jgi:hypothetical protein